jgi:hypothetical protein
VLLPASLECQRVEQQGTCISGGLAIHLCLVHVSGAACRQSSRPLGVRALPD